jgi:hypothetical protein
MNERFKFLSYTGLKTNAIYISVRVLLTNKKMSYFSIISLLHINMDMTRFTLHVFFQKQGRFAL